MDRTWKTLISISDALGYLLWLLAASYTFRFFIEIDNPLRHELGIGMGMAALYGFWPALFSLIAAVALRKRIGKKLLFASVALLPLFGALLGAYSVAT